MALVQELGIADGDELLLQGAVFKNRIAVSKCTLRSVESKALPGGQIDRIQIKEAILKLNPIGANVLHRRGAHRARDQGQIFQTGPTLIKGPGHKIMPILSSHGLHQVALFVLPHEPFALELHLEHHGFHVTR